VDADLTLTEATTILSPPITERQLRMIVAALNLPRTGARLNGRPGKPCPTYAWADLERLHAALLPWLTQ
jgi:hypothetical protein